MEAGFPLISIIMATYNRAKTIERAINSVLNQSYKNIELILIDDGSTDNTAEILKKYYDPRIRLYKHELNKGVTAAKNLGLRLIKGEWFTTFDSDDEMMPDAIETMINIPLVVDEKITAVTCNCWDTISNSFSGKGLVKDGYIDIYTLTTFCKGDFWGITRTSLLGGDRFNEKLKGFESILWYKISDRANRYYIHKALSIVHTEGSDRISKLKYNFKEEINLYENLICEDFYLNIIKKYRLSEYHSICKNGLIVMRASNNNYLASKYYELINSSKKSLIINLIYQYKMVSKLFQAYSSFKVWLKPYLYTLLRN